MDNSYYTWLRAAAMDTAPIIIAETIGTAFYIFGGCIGTSSWDGKKPNTLIPSITFGLVATVIIQCYIHLPNNHPYLNPAVTLAALINRKTSISMSTVYVLAQFIGGIIGFWLLKFLTPTKIFAQSSDSYGVCQTFPNEYVNVLDPFIIEYISTMFWISMFCAVWDPRTQQNSSLPLIFGLAITILSLIFIPYTGCSMNPVRSFAPAFWAENYQNQWIYWDAPLLSSLITSIGYRMLFLRERQSNVIAFVESIHYDDSVKVSHMHS